jgi:uncharacterized protein YecE (DUF72 family)
MADRVRVGCSSWTSEAWWGKVYPQGLPDGQRLLSYSRLYDTVEVDSTYYAIPAAAMVRRWSEVTPQGFTFALKFPRDLMDPKRPVDEAAVSTFTGRAKILGPKLGPVLLQFPPWFRPGAKNTAFLENLVAALDPDIRYSVEVRHASWFSGDPWSWLKDNLSRKNLALTWSSLTYVEVPQELTSDLLYMRFIGDHVTVPTETHGEVRVDRSREVDTWASRVKDALPRVRTAFAYFNNHFQGFAPESANLFLAAMGMAKVDYSAEVKDSASAQKVL